MESSFDPYFFIHPIFQPVLTGAALLEACFSEISDSSSASAAVNCDQIRWKMSPGGSSQQIIECRNQEVIFQHIWGIPVILYFVSHWLDSTERSDLEALTMSFLIETLLCLLCFIENLERFQVQTTAVTECLFFH